MKMVYKGLKRCPLKAHVLEDWSPGWCYREIVKPLRGRVLQKVHRSWGACPCRDRVVWYLSLSLYLGFLAPDAGNQH